MCIVTGILDKAITQARAVVAVFLPVDWRPTYLSQWTRPREWRSGMRGTRRYRSHYPLLQSSGRSDCFYVYSTREYRQAFLHGVSGSLWLADGR